MRKLPALSLAVATLALCASSAAWSNHITPEDQKIIEAANCEELVKEYRNFAAAEKKLAEEIRQTSNNTTAGNVVGVATLAVFGLGFSAGMTRRTPRPIWPS